MKSLVKALLVLVISLIVGIGSALALIYHPPVMPGVKNGSWVTNLKVGSPDAGMYVRAVVARVGLFALNKTETIYYSAYEDQDGNRLRTNCDYSITGRDIPARWWSLTVYGEDNFLIPNDQRIYSYNMTNLKRKPASRQGGSDGSFAISVSQSPKPGNWLPAGAADQNLNITLRCYNPEPVLYQQPDKVELPRIIKEGCR